MDENQIIDEAETIEPDLRLEYTDDGQFIEVRETEEEQKSKLVNSYIESWAAHFGSAKNRRQGKRLLCFDEGIADLAEQVGFCVQALPVLAETMTAEAWRGGIGEGLCVITSLVCESAYKTIQVLDEELKLAEHENRKLREQLKQTNNHSE